MLVLSRIRNGFVEAELLLAVAVLGILVTSMGGGMIYARQSLHLADERERANLLAEEGLEAVRAIRDYGWNELEYEQSAVTTGSEWAFSGEGTTETIDSFTRTINFSEVCRDTSDLIVACPGDKVDLESQRVSVTVDYGTILGVNQSVTKEALLTNWRGTDFVQTDWSGGSGQSILVDESRYESDNGSVNTTTTGQISLAGGSACSSQVWEFDSATEYAYNPFEISVSGGLASIQTTTGEWWNESYRYRNLLTVTTGNNAPEGGYQEYTVSSGDIDTASLIASGKMLSDCSDLRTTFFNGSTSVEIDRNVINCNTSSTQVHFALQTNLDDSSTSEDYGIYYGNSSPDAELNNLSNVYLWFDDAQLDGSTNYTVGRGDAWHGTGGSSSFSWNSNGYYTMNTGDNFTESIRIPGVTRVERDAYFEAEFYHTNAYPNDMTTGVVGRYIASSGAGTSTESADHYYASTRADSPFLAGGYTTDRSIVKTDRITVAASGATGGALVGNQWRKQALAVWGSDATNLRYWDNNSASAMGPLAFPSQTVTTAGTDSSYQTEGEWGIIAAQDQLRIRNITLRRYTDPEPVVSIGVEQDFSSNSDIALNPSPLDTLEYDTIQGRFPSYTKVSEEIFAVAYRGSSNDGYVSTLLIQNDGTIGGVIDTLEYDTGNSSFQDIVHLSGDVYAIAYQGSGSDGWLTTVEIDALGQITDTVLDSHEFDTSNGREPTIVHLGNGFVAIAYRGPGNDGFLATYSVSALGIINPIEVDSLEFETSLGVYPYLFPISNNVYGIAYRGPGNDGFITTVSISPIGSIGSIVDTFEFDSSQGYWPMVINISGNTYAVVYEGGGGDGYISTLDIEPTGVINGVINTIEYDTTDGSYPYIQAVTGEYYLVSENRFNSGRLYLMKITSGGSISVESEIEFSSSAEAADILLLDADTIAVVFAGSGTDGFINTYQLETSESYVETIPSINPINSYTPSDVTGWSGFIETANKNGGEIYYQLSENNGASWLYYDGASWTAAGANDYNTANEISSAIIDFPITSQSVTFRAFLESDGSQLVQLDSVEIACGNFQMETNEVTVSDEWTTVTLTNSYVDPVIVALSDHINNTESQSVRIRNVSDSTFDIRIHNPSNTALSAERVQYLVMEAGSWNYNGLIAEARNVTTSTVASSGNGWNGDEQTFQQSFTNDPVVLHQVVSENDSNWVSSFVRSVNSQSNPPTATGFEIAMNAAQVSSSYSHGTETIAWIALEQTTPITVDGVQIEIIRTGDSILGIDNSCESTSFIGSYTSVPQIIGSQQEMDGSDGSWSTLCSDSITDVGFYASEDQVSDTERAHINETLGFIALSSPLTVTASGGAGGATETVLISSSFDMGNNGSVSFIDWDENLSACPTTCDIEVEVRVASDNTGSPGTWSNWYGVTGAGSVYSDAGGGLISSELNGNQWVQYRVKLIGDGVGSPVLEEIRVNYR